MTNEKKVRPQERWDKKNGYISKSFKMYKSIADDFRVACEKAGCSQASVIQELMKDYINKQNGDTSEKKAG